MLELFADTDTLWGDKFIEEVGQFVFTANVTRSRQNGKRVHVHLMVHERTMATAEGTLFLRSAETMQAEPQLKVKWQGESWNQCLEIWQQ